MSSATDKTRARFQRLLSRGQDVLRGATPGAGMFAGNSYVSDQDYASWRSQAEAALIDTFGERHAYTRSFADLGRKTSKYVVESQVGVISGVLEAIDHGELGSLTSLVVANVFSDFLEMADHLLQNSYHVAAASLGGAVLEDTLRRLCAGHSISHNAKAGIDDLNKKLGDASVFDAFTVSSVNAWRHLRNDADHGHFQNVQPANVEAMLRGMRTLMLQHARELGGTP